jgi:hypothetical protein
MLLHSIAEIMQHLFSLVNGLLQDLFQAVTDGVSPHVAARLQASSAEPASRATVG